MKIQLISPARIDQTAAFIGKVHDRYVVVNLIVLSVYLHILGDSQIIRYNCCKHALYTETIKALYLYIKVTVLFKRNNFY
jgi:hypothetical protein